MGGRLRLVAGAVAGILLGACTAAGPGDRPRAVPRAEGGDQSALWPPPSDIFSGAGSRGWWGRDAVPTELSPTGLEVVARPGARSLVVDGSGRAWLHGPWHLVRVDPSTGVAETWDVGDDAAFGSILDVRASRDSGAWLILPDRALLFDGEAFVREVRLPAAYRGGDDGGVADLVEVGAEVWVASPAGVARWTGWAWGLVRPEQLTAVEALAVDPGGTVWAVGQHAVGDRPRQAVVRFDGVRWAEPAPEGGPDLARRIVAHPAGGVVVLDASDVRRFDGTSWQVMPRAGDRRGIGDPAPSALAITDDGVMWVLGDRGPARVGPGGWTTLARAGSPPAVGMAALGEDLLLADGSGLHRVVGDIASEVWSGRPPGPVASRAGIGASNPGGEPAMAAGEPLRVDPGRLVAVSAEEVWALSDGYPYPLRYSNGEWREVPMAPVQWQAPVPATDGAVWLGTSRAVVRVRGATQTRVSSVPVGDGARTGPDGSILVLPSEWYGWWYADGYEDGVPEYVAINRVSAQGGVTAIPLPVGRWSLTSVVAGPGDVIWAAACISGQAGRCPTSAELFRWDAGWAPVAYPGSDATLVGVAEDGALWALIEVHRETPGAPGGRSVLARHVDGRWEQVLDDAVPHGMLMAPAGSVCWMDGASPELVCVDASGRTARWQVGVPGEIRIGLDGSVWLARDGMVARLPFDVGG